MTKHNLYCLVRIKHTCGERIEQTGWQDGCILYGTHHPSQNDLFQRGVFGPRDQQKMQIERQLWATRTPARPWFCRWRALDTVHGYSIQEERDASIHWCGEIAGAVYCKL